VQASGQDVIIMKDSVLGYLGVKHTTLGGLTRGAIVTLFGVSASKVQHCRHFQKRDKADPTWWSQAPKKLGEIATQIVYHYLSFAADSNAETPAAKASPTTP
jgi:hypothetical protein